MSPHPLSEMELHELEKLQKRLLATTMVVSTFACCLFSGIPCAILTFYYAELGGVAKEFLGLSIVVLFACSCYSIAGVRILKDMKRQMDRDLNHGQD